MLLSVRDIEEKFVRFVSPDIGVDRVTTMAPDFLEGPLSSSVNDIFAG